MNKKKHTKKTKVIITDNEILDRSIPLPSSIFLMCVHKFHLVNYNTNKNLATFICDKCGEIKEVKGIKQSIK